MTRRPARIDIGGIDGIEAAIDEGVENIEAGRLVGGPPEDVAAKDKRRDLRIRMAESALFHGCPPLMVFFG